MLFAASQRVNPAADSNDEMRYLAIGYIGDVLHTVIYTERGNRIRIISLRKASNDERGRYAQS